MEFSKILLQSQRDCNKKEYSVYYSHYQVTMIRIVAVRDGDVTEIVKVSVYVLVGREDAGLHDVTKHIYATKLGQRHPLAAGVDVGAGVNGLVDTIAPSFQILKVEV